MSAARRARSILGIVVLTICAITAAYAQDDSVRFATYNVQLVPNDMLLTTAEERAGKIADRILAADYDFVALNESFDEETRDVLVRRLAPAYAHRVEALGGSGAFTGDSGLMLFRSSSSSAASWTAAAARQTPTTRSPAAPCRSSSGRCSTSSLPTSAAELPCRP